MKNKGIGALAEQVASKGRGGDSILMHIQPEELAGIAALLGQDLTINPETGMPEAWSWKKLLAAVGLGAAAVFTAGGGLAAILPALSIGTGAGTATTLGALATQIATPALISSAASQAVGALKPDANKQNQQALSDADQWLKNKTDKEYGRQRFVTAGDAGLTAGSTAQQVAQGGIGTALNLSPYFNQLLATQQAPQPQEDQEANQPPRAFAEGGDVEDLEPEEKKAQQIIRDAMDAIRGDSENPESALNTYISFYGKEALEDLYKRMSGEEDEGEGNQQNNDQGPVEGLIKGPGNGMDDMATARMAHGGQKVLLSNDEFIIPADVVSGLGDGSSEAGARKLYAMMDRVRMDRTGTTKQPGKVKDHRVIPA